MTQTLAIFLDAYRNLQSKRLFWLVLALSGLVVGCFGLLGINDRGLVVGIWQLDHPWLNTHHVKPATLYKWLFATLGIGVWLSWIGTILALISTAGIFPDLLTCGSIDLVVSRPISRLRLFLTQYVAGLLFVTLQATVFSLASFLVIGLRGGVWEPGLFVAVPVLVVFFSYLFSVCVLIGVKTRSTVAALLLTLLFWFFVYAVSASENTLLMFRNMRAEGMSWSIGPEAETAQATPGNNPPRSQQPSDGASNHQTPRGLRSLDTMYSLVYALHTALPKTNETVDLLERWLIRFADLPKRDHNPSAQEKVTQRTIQAIRSRSPWWILGTSLGFETVVLAWAAASFCRRDF